MLFLSLFMTACGGANKDIGSTEYIFDNISRAVEFDTRMPDLGAARLGQYYSIDSGKVENFVAKLPPSAAFASEIVIIKFLDNASAKAAKKGFVERAEEIMKSFKTYIPAQYEIAKQYVLSVKGSYLLFVIHEDSRIAEEEFEKLFR